MKRKFTVLISIVMVIVMMFAFTVNTFAAVKCVNITSARGTSSEYYTVQFSQSNYAQFLRVENVGKTRITITANGISYNDIYPGSSKEICFKGNQVKKSGGLQVVLQVQIHGNGASATYNIKTSSGTIR